MILNENNGIKYFTFEKMNNIKHCFSTRVGGVSEGCYKSLNLAFRQDSRENVLENYRRICSVIGVDYKNTFWTRQVHTDRIVRAFESDRGKGLFYDRQEEGYDALITNVKDIVLTGFSADCVLIFFYDPVNEAIGIAHSGWRGTVLKIGAKTVEAMGREFGTLPRDLICGIAPAIGKCCFQVDKPVVDEFLANIQDCGEFIIKDDSCEGKYYIDLHSINEMILLDVGVKKENIENSRICTKCNSDLFFSHRLMGNERGSMAGMISL